MEYLKNSVVSQQGINHDAGILGRNLDPDRVGQTRTLQFRDFCCHCRGEQIGRPLLGYDFQNFVYDRAKIQVQQLIGLIKYLR